MFLQDDFSDSDSNGDSSMAITIAKKAKTIVTKVNCGCNPF